MDIEKELSNLRKRLETGRRGEKLGLEVEYGLFVDEEGFGHNHCWFKKNGMIYDITADQFSGNLPRILMLKTDSKEASKRYLEGVFYMF